MRPTMACRSPPRRPVDAYSCTDSSQYRDRGRPSVSALGVHDSHFIEPNLVTKTERKQTARATAPRVRCVQPRRARAAPQAAPAPPRPPHPPHPSPLTLYSCTWGGGPPHPPSTKKVDLRSQSYRGTQLSVISLIEPVIADATARYYVDTTCPRESVGVASRLRSSFSRNPNPLRGGPNRLRRSHDRGRAS